MILYVNEQQLKSAFACKAKEDARHWLTGIRFMENGDLVASNGHYLYLGEHQSKGIATGVTVFFVGKKLPVRFGKCEIDTAQGVARFFDRIVPDKVIAAMPIEYSEDEYTDYARVTGEIKPKAVEQVGFTGNYFSLVGNISKIWNSQFNQIIMTLQGESTAAVITFKNFEGEQSKLFLMPARI